MGEGEKPNYIEGKIVFGLNNYFALNNLLLEIKTENANKIFADIRAFHALYDHKVYLIELINYLGKNNILHQCESFVDRYTKLKIECLKNRNLFIKYLIRKKMSLLMKL